MSTITLPARIADRLVPEPNTGCYLWDGPVNDKGYGRIWFDGKNMKLPRVIFFLVHGYWPDHALHSCDTPACGNPDHLRDGDNLENSRERHAKGRTRGCCSQVAA